MYLIRKIFVSLWSEIGDMEYGHLKRKSMTKEQRTATARIVNDMFKADKTIKESESKDMKKFMSDYDSTYQEVWLHHE